MSQLSDSSENYQEIIANLLNFKKQWAQVPETVYLTIKALHSHSQELEEHLYQERQDLAEISIKLKELAVDFNDLKTHYESAFHKESGFKKKKSGNENSIYSKHQSSRPNRKDSPGTKRKDQSLFLEHGLTEIMIEEVRALIEASISHRSVSIHPELDKLKKELSNKNEERQENLTAQLERDLSSIRSEFDSKMAKFEEKVSQKLQSERANVMQFAQESTMEMQKLLIEINNIQIRMCDLTDADRQFGNIKPKKQEPCENEKITTKNNKQPTNKQSVGERRKTETNLADLISNINRQFTDFKLKTMKEMAFFMRTQTVEQLMVKFQEETMEKMSKFNKNYGKLAKEIESIRREALRGDQKVPVVKLEQPQPKSQKQKKQKTTEKTLTLIQESLSRVETHFRDKLKSTRSQILQQTTKKIDEQCQDLHKAIIQEIEVRERTLCEIVEANCNKLIQLQQQDYQATGNAEVRRAVEKVAQQMIMARFLSFGQKGTRDVIHWDSNPVNFLEDNFVWKANSHLVLVMAAGLYRLEAGIFPDNDADRTQAYVMMNGNAIAMLKSKQVPINCLAPSRGSLFNEAILLPGKSKIWVKTDESFYGQAYLQIVKL